MFFTRQKDKYYQGLTDEEVDKGKVESEASVGSIVRLPLPVPIATGMSVWIAETGQVFIAPKTDPFAGNRLVEIYSESHYDRHSADNIQSALRRLWRSSADKEALALLLDSPEWEKVIYFLKIQLPAVRKRDLPDWVYTLLSSYDATYGKIFHTYCSSQQIRVVFETESIRIGEEGEEMHFYMTISEEALLHHQKQTVYP